MINSIGILKKLIFVASPIFIIHVLLFNTNLINGKEADFYYSIPLLYGLFFMLSAVILIIVTKISEKNFDNTGMVFMIATSIKMVVAFFLVRPILPLEDNKIEKINFFIIFILFLLIETILVAKILNKK
jgi:predicted transporter